MAVPGYYCIGDASFSGIVQILVFAAEPFAIFWRSVRKLTKKEPTNVSMKADFNVFHHDVESETLIKRYFFFKATQEGIQSVVDDCPSRDNNYNFKLQSFLSVTENSKFNQYLPPCSCTKVDSYPDCHSYFSRFELSKCTKDNSRHNCHSHFSRCEVCHRECSGSGHMSCGKCCSGSEQTTVVAVGYSSKAIAGQDGSFEPESPLDLCDDLHSVFVNDHDDKEPLPWFFVAYLFQLCLFWIICLLVVFLLLVGIFCSYLSVNFAPVLFFCLCVVYLSLCSRYALDLWDDFHRHCVFEHDDKEPQPWFFVAYAFQLCLFWIICLFLFLFGVFCSYLSVIFAPILFFGVHGVYLWCSSRYARWWSQTSTAVRCYSLTSKCLFLIIV
jgi:hypothetical protein